MNNITILAIESSCDDTSAAIIRNGILLSNCIANQKIHEEYGGVVPELASRSHLQNILPVIHAAIKKANIEISNIDAIACTSGPGLLGSLLVGVSFVKGFAMAHKCKIIEVNHLHAHILASFIQEPEKEKQKPQFPFLCLLVSGGHTQIIKVESALDMHIMGSTIDDAAGECFDKSAKLLELPYPGGPHIDALAQIGNPKAYSFNKPKIENYDYSFSGLKTSILYFLQAEQRKNNLFIEENKADICASIQHTIVEILLNKLEIAIENTGIHDIVIGGGVAANSGLRNAISHLGKTKNLRVFLPELQYTTDNAAMIGITAHYKYLAGQFSDIHISPHARYSLEEYFDKNMPTK